MQGNMNNRYKHLSWCIQGMGSNEAATLNGVQRKKQNPNKYKELFFIQLKGTTCDLY